MFRWWTVLGLLSIQLAPVASVRSGVEVTNCLAAQICLTLALFAKKMVNDVVER